LRAAGIGVELYPEPRKLGTQLKYADARGFQIALIAGESEWAAGKCQVKNLAAKTSAEVAYSPGAAGPLLAAIQQQLAAAAAGEPLPEAGGRP